MLVPGCSMNQGMHPRTKYWPFDSAISSIHKKGEAMERRELFRSAGLAITAAPLIHVLPEKLTYDLLECTCGAQRAEVSNPAWFPMPHKGHAFHYDFKCVECGRKTSGLKFGSPIKGCEHVHHELLQGIDFA